MAREINWCGHYKHGIVTFFQFSKVDPTYDQVYLSLSRRGARVLALGWKNMGSLSHEQIRGKFKKKIEGRKTKVNLLILIFHMGVFSRVGH